MTARTLGLAILRPPSPNPLQTAACTFAITPGQIILGVISDDSSRQNLPSLHSSLHTSCASIIAFTLRLAFAANRSCLLCEQEQVGPAVPGSGSLQILAFAAPAPHYQPGPSPCSLHERAALSLSAMRSAVFPDAADDSCGICRQQQIPHPLLPASSSLPGQQLLARWAANEPCCRVGLPAYDGISLLCGAAFWPAKHDPEVHADTRPIIMSSIDFLCRADRVHVLFRSCRPLWAAIPTASIFTPSTCLMWLCTQASLPRRNRLHLSRSLARPPILRIDQLHLAPCHHQPIPPYLVGQACSNQDSQCLVGVSLEAAKPHQAASNSAAGSVWRTASIQED